MCSCQQNRSSMFCFSVWYIFALSPQNRITKVNACFFYMMSFTLPLCCCHMSCVTVTKLWAKIWTTKLNGTYFNHSIQSMVLLMVVKNMTTTQKFKLLAQVLRQNCFWFWKSHCSHFLWNWLNSCSTDCHSPDVFHLCNSLVTNVHAAFAAIIQVW